MALIAIKDKMIGLVKPKDPYQNYGNIDKEGFYFPSEQTTFTRAGRQFLIHCIGWIGNPSVFAFLRHELETQKDFDKAWETMLSAINIGSLRTLQLIMVVSQQSSIRSTSLPTVFKASFEVIDPEALHSKDINTPLKLRVKMQDNGKSKDWIYISSKGESISAKTPIKEIEFLEKHVLVL